MSDTPDHIIEVPRDVRPTEASLLAKIKSLEMALADARRVHEQSISGYRSCGCELDNADKFCEGCAPPWRPEASSPEGETE